VNRVVAPEALLDVCHALAGDMVSCVPEVLTAYKRLIDEGLRMPLGPALEMETARAIASAAAAGSEDVAARRAGVMARGRQEDSS
jgi:enoyl-CoA hydratase